MWVNLEGTSILSDRPPSSWSLWQICASVPTKPSEWCGRSKHILLSQRGWKASDFQPTGGTFSLDFPFIVRFKSSATDAEAYRETIDDCPHRSEYERDESGEEELDEAIGFWMHEKERAEKSSWIAPCGRSAAPNTASFPREP